MRIQDIEIVETKPGHFAHSVKLMGNQFVFTAVHHKKSVAQKAIEKGVIEVKRIENLLTTFSDTSETARINAGAGVCPVSVCDEVFQLIHRCIRISEITQGAFDITYGSVHKDFWNFNTKMMQLPDHGVLNASIKLVDFNRIELDPIAGTVFLPLDGMRIGFGGIGKGYAADRACLVMKSMGAESGVVNASGDLRVWGTQSSGHGWTIGVANPNMKNQLFSSLTLHEQSIATSGDYEKFATIQGKKHQHTIHPKTGRPVEGVKSVSVICSSAELADALTTPVMIMGPEIGLDLINQLQGVEAIVIDDHDHLFISKNIKIIHS